MSNKTVKWDARLPISEIEYNIDLVIGYGFVSEAYIVCDADKSTFELQMDGVKNAVKIH